MKVWLQILRLWWAGLVQPAAGAMLILTPASAPDRLPVFRYLIIAIAILYAIYGFSMGLFRGVWPGCVSAGKLSFLYIFTLSICLPSLYVLNCLVGLRLGLRACLRVLVLALSVNAVALGSYAFVSLFFTLTASHHEYQTIVLMHVAVFGFAGLVSLIEIGLLMRAMAIQLNQRLRPSFLISWGVLYAFVGTQVSWVLRPWIGSWSVPYAPFRPIEGSFAEMLWRLLFT